MTFISKKLLLPNPSFWKGKKVLITGHTGFKGSWLSLWLMQMGSNISGVSLEPTSKINLFSKLNIENKINHNLLDIRNKESINNLISLFNPDIVFHLAAQPLVLKSYLDPMETWETNVIGSINIMESLRNTKKKCSLIMVTTDKVYKNNEWIYGYRETDPLGGKDPYSSSKAAAELAINSWRSSFCGDFDYQNPNLLIASARAGNVIGGGDWAENRIIPDTIRSLSVNEEVLLRNPYSTRPWQHVLDPLNGYILLAENLYKDGDKFASSFNFGPKLESNRNVKELVDEVFKYWPGKLKELNNSNTKESSKLNLTIEKAYDLLGWTPRWNFIDTVKHTISWYQKVHNKEKSELESCLNDISLFSKID